MVITEVKMKKIIMAIICCIVLVAAAVSCDRTGDNTASPGENGVTEDGDAKDIADSGKEDDGISADNPDSGTDSVSDEDTKDNESKEPDVDENTPDVSNRLTEEEEMEIFNSIIASIPLKAEEPVKYKFSNVSVHDPSVIRIDDTYYIFGSHLAAAKSTDLMNWTLIASGVTPTNPIIPNAQKEMEEAFKWARTDTFWAPDVVQLEDGRFYYYYCNCEGSSPLSALGYAVSDNIEGPYKNLGILLRSGMKDELSENGDAYDARIHPNVVDPHVFFDKEGRLWMLYGSYSGGIYILELDPKTGRPLESGYGKKLLGENHLRIEGGYVQYSPETDYYYLFLSFGGLDRAGGYNIRIARSKNPDGPYYDYEGNNMIDCKGPKHSFFDDNTAQKYGSKLMGSYRWNSVEGEDSNNRQAYLSPGHNSTIYQEETGKYFIIFHTRFENRGEHHEVRVHQMFLNEDGWFVIAPYRYVGETIGTFTEEEIAGAYKAINHGKDISPRIKQSVNIVLQEDHTVIGDMNGTWELKDGNKLTLTIDETVYKGVVLKQWDEFGLKNVITFSVLSEEGISIWGSGYEAK
ncbi:MAG: glycoside hydrolase family 43 protein [Clostridiales bacterium]|nr:glycoside hydrolase family 43 protein [Clostridiales bacterium]